MTRRIRTTQPTSWCPIERGHPFARGLSLAYVPYFASGSTSNAYPTNTPNRRVSAQANISYGLGEYGRYWQTNGATNDRIALGNTDNTSIRVITSNTDWTIAVLAAPTQTIGATSAMFSQRSNSGSVEQIDLLRGRAGLLSPDERCFEIYYRDTSGNPYYADNSLVFNNAIDGLWHLYGGSCQTLSGGTLQLDIWRDGVNVTERRTTPSGTFISSNQTSWLGNIGGYTVDGAFAAACPMSLHLVWDGRALSPFEWLQLAANPWQVFEALPRFVVSGFAAASASVEVPLVGQACL